MSSGCTYSALLYKLGSRLACRANLHDRMRQCAESLGLPNNNEWFPSLACYQRFRRVTYSSRQAAIICQASNPDAKVSGRYPHRHYSAPNAHAVHSPIAVGCTCACRANISRSTRLIDAGVNHAHPRCANANAGYNPYSRRTDTGYWARDTSFWHAHGLAINNGARGNGSETKAQG